MAIYVFYPFRFVYGYSEVFFFFKKKKKKKTFGVLFDVLADKRKGGQKEMQSQK